MSHRKETISTHRPPLLAVLLCLSFALMACGDDGDGTGDGRTLTDPTEIVDEAPNDGSVVEGAGSFIQRADELCLATQRALSRAELEEFGKPGPDTVPPTRAERQRFVEEVVAPTWRGSAESMIRIDPPESQAEAIDDWIETLISGVRVLGEPAAIIRDPEVESTALIPAEQAAERIGLERCSQTSVSVRDYAAVYKP